MLSRLKSKIWVHGRYIYNFLCIFFLSYALVILHVHFCGVILHVRFCGGAHTPTHNLPTQANLRMHSTNHLAVTPLVAIIAGFEPKAWCPKGSIITTRPNLFGYMEDILIKHFVSTRATTIVPTNAT